MIKEKKKIIREMINPPGYRGSYGEPPKLRVHDKISYVITVVRSTPTYYQFFFFFLAYFINFTDCGRVDKNPIEFP